MGSYKLIGIVFGTLIFSLFFSEQVYSQMPLEGAMGEIPAINSCDQAISRYQDTQIAFNNLSERCQNEAGVSSAATLDDCPSVSRTEFISLLGDLERGRYVVCENCAGVWPSNPLGPGACLLR